MRPRLFRFFSPCGLVLAFATSGCGGGGTGSADASIDGHPDARTTDATLDGGGEADAPLWPTPPAWNANVTRPPKASAAAADRAACKFKRGDMPAASVDPSFPLDAENPIENIVVLLQENHSFDTYMGHLWKYAKKSPTEIDSAPDSTTNPDSMGMPHPYQHAPQLCFADTDHSWHGSHVEWDNGKNDGFYLANNGTQIDDAGQNLLDGDRALWWYDERDIPFYYSLYSTFAIGDHYHCALLSATDPNRMYVYAATSFGNVASSFPDLSKYMTVPTNLVVTDELAQRGISFNIFAESAPAIVLLGPTILTRYGSLKPLAAMTEFFDRAKKGTLPQVSFLDPDFLGEGPTGDDEHPPAQIQIGQQFVWKVVHAITTSPQWAHTALFITYDEHGGEFDHVPPPPACAPDDIQPILTGTDKGTPGDFKRYGFRVPMVLISPYAKKAFVSHRVYSHTSITRFIEAKFKLPALTARDANEDPFTDMFDWKNPPFMKPPSFPEPKVDMNAVNFCVSHY